MKIVHVETGRHFYGGAQQVVWLLKGLRDWDVDNVLVCPPRSGIDAAARDSGIRVVNVDCAGDIDFPFASRLKKVLERERPDLLHSHSRRGADVLGGIAAQRARVPAIVSRRVDHPESRLTARLRYRPFRRIVAISGHVAAVLRESGVDPARITVIRSAVDSKQVPAARDAVDSERLPAARDAVGSGRITADRSSVRSERVPAACGSADPGRHHAPPEQAGLIREFGVPEHGIAIAAAGQLIPRKGHRYLLEAMAIVAGQMPDAHLVIFGQGRLASELKARAAVLGLAERVRFAGFREGLGGSLGAFDLLVHPALREGLGVVMLEAAAAGVPVVAFDVAGSREAVADGETGLLVPPRDTGALAEAMLRLAGDPALRELYGEAGRRRMRREFSIEVMVDRHLRLYETVLSEAE